MNFRNRYLVITIRTLLGLFLLFSGISGFMAGASLEGVPPEMVPYMKVLMETGIFHMIKVTEIVAGLMLVFNLLPALAVLFIAPLAVGIIVFNSTVEPQYLPAGLVVFIFNAYLGYAYWDKYKAIFTRK